MEKHMRLIIKCCGLQRAEGTTAVRGSLYSSLLTRRTTP